MNLGDFFLSSRTTKKAVSQSSPVPVHSISIKVIILKEGKVTQAQVTHSLLPSQNEYCIHYSFHSLPNMIIFPLVACCRQHIFLSLSFTLPHVLLPCTLIFHLPTSYSFPSPLLSPLLPLLHYRWLLLLIASPLPIPFCFPSTFKMLPLLQQSTSNPPLLTSNTKKQTLFFLSCSDTSYFPLFLTERKSRK